MTKVFNFPKKPQKDELHLLVPESDFSLMMKKMIRSFYNGGRRDGFFIGFAAANLLNVIIQYFLR